MFGNVLFDKQAEKDQLLMVLFRIKSSRVIYQINYQLMGNQQTKGRGLFQSKQKGGYQSLKEGASNICKCSIKTRIIGWVVCFAIGWLLSLFTTITFLVNTNFNLFAILFSVGQFINIAGSCFLATPKTQIKDMFKKVRWLLTLLYLGSTIATIVLALLLPANLKPLILITLIIQIISYYLYTFSYVPFGRKILKKFCQCIFID